MRNLEADLQTIVRAASDGRLTTQRAATLAGFVVLAEHADVLENVSERTWRRRLADVRALGLAEPQLPPELLAKRRRESAERERRRFVERRRPENDRRTGEERRAGRRNGS